MGIQNYSTPSDQSALSIQLRCGNKWVSVMLIEFIQTHSLNHTVPKAAITTKHNPTDANVNCVNRINRFCKPAVVVLLKHAT